LRFKTTFIQRMSREQEAHMRLFHVIVALALNLPMIATAVAQRAETLMEGDNMYPAGSPNSCQTFAAATRNADRGLMEQLSGVWQSEVPVPAVPSVFLPTTNQIKMTRYPQGTLLYEEYQCFRPISAPGYPAQPQRCATASGRGAWFARPTGPGQFLVGVLQEGSGFGGNHVGPNCTMMRGRFLDQNTIQNEFGGVGRRVGAAQ
jgi:hypothetical protein